MVVETEPMVRVAKVNGPIAEEPQNQTKEDIGQKFSPVVPVRLHRTFRKEAGDEQKRRHVETINEEEEAAVREVVVTGPFQGMAQDHQQNQQKLGIVPARVALSGGRGNQILSRMLRMVRRNMSSMPTEG